MAVLRRKLMLNLRQLAIAGWILAALALLAAAGGGMRELFAIRSAAESREVAAARRKLGELTEATDAGVAASNFDRLDRLLASTPAQDAAETTAAIPPPAAEQPESYALPVLTGIMKVVSARGEVRYRALLDGRDLGEGERFDGFTIRRITDAGVVLTRGAQRWTLPSPEVVFTLKQE